MNVTHVITKGDVGGAQTHVVELAAAQMRAGIAVSVIAGTSGPALDRCREAGADTAVVPSLGAARSQPWQRGVVRDLSAAIVATEPDVVHAHSSNAGLVARVACRRRHIPCVYTAHGWPFQRGAAFPQRVMSLVAELFAGRIGDAVICLTEAEADRARRAHVARRDRLWVVPNGLADVGDDLVRHRHGGEAPTMVMVARFAPPKGQRELVTVLGSVLDLEWSITFVGDGPDLADCRSYAESEIPGRAVFVGHRDDVAEILAAHDVLVLWSAYEGLPISVLEGMRAGLCCVASALPGTTELLADVGELAGGPDELRAVLRRVLADPARRAEAGRGARRAFLERFAIDAVEPRIRAVYDAVRYGSAR